MKDKSKVFLNGFRMVLIQFENLIKRLSCDIGNEYVLVSFVENLTVHLSLDYKLI
jgi:hypothetical protein